MDWNKRGGNTGQNDCGYKIGEKGGELKYLNMDLDFGN